MTGAGLRIAVFGATSALAQAAVRRWAAQGASLVLVARDADRLDAVAPGPAVRTAKRSITRTAPTRASCQRTTPRVRSASRVSIRFSVNVSAATAPWPSRSSGT